MNSSQISEEEKVKKIRPKKLYYKKDFIKQNMTPKNKEIEQYKSEEFIFPGKNDLAISVESSISAEVFKGGVGD